MTRRCSASASAYASAPSSCRSLVEPSTSVKRKVTVPVGRSSRTRRDHPPQRSSRLAPHPPPRDVLGRWGLVTGQSVASPGDELVNSVVNCSRRTECGPGVSSLSSCGSVTPSRAQRRIRHALHAGGRRFESCTAHRRTRWKRRVSSGSPTALVGISARLASVWQVQRPNCRQEPRAPGPRERASRFGSRRARVHAGSDPSDGRRDFRSGRA